jgi:hypothetical protein
VELTRNASVEELSIYLVERIQARRPWENSQAEMENAYRNYLELHFLNENQLCTSLVDAFLEGGNTLFSVGADTVNIELGQDIGIQHMIAKSSHELLHLLGLNVDNGQYPFGEPGGTKDGNGEMKEKICPKWHQLVGTAVMLERMFTDRPRICGDPSMLCDDVGLGKTLQIIGTISMLVHIIELQKQGRPLPPLLKGNHLV